MMETAEIKYEKEYASPRLPPNNRMKELVSEVAGSSKDTPRIKPKPKTQLSRTERPVSEQPSRSSAQEIEKVSCLAAKAPT